jgi:predicted glutamine amidotransferase
MCRLLGYASATPTTLSDAAGKNFDQLVELANDHCDGWGIASANHGSHNPDLYKEPVAATKSATFKDKLAHSPSDGALLHLRWATEGMDVKESNTHPFTYNGISFIHNGSISPFNSLDPHISPKYLALAKGTTDSERYFLYLLTEIEKHGFIEGTKAALTYIKNNCTYSSINMMAINEDTFLVACIYNQDKIPAKFTDDTDYYHLRYKKTQDQILVGSSGWNQDGWEELPNGSLLVVDRKTLSSEIINIKG